MGDGIPGKTARRFSRAVRRASAPCLVAVELVLIPPPCRAGAEFVWCLVAVEMVLIPPHAELALASFRI